MLKIYNTLTRKKEEFVPIVDGHVGMYVCGPTVYGMPHLGHAKSYVNFDVVHRFFKFLGYKVKYVQNITDVGHLVGDGDSGEDKINRQAKLEKLDPYEIAYKYECEYFKSMDALNILRPSISCRATGFIIDIIEAVKQILDAGFAYVTKDGNVYFDVHKYANYGQLSHRTLDKNVSGERVEIADDKKNAEDFALWKAVDSNALMKWNSPWGVGCPGWHIECSVLARKFLGDEFDIHGGGIDNIFPHHECECAQGDILTGKVPMHYFMHNNLVTVNGTKMGKSLGNSVTLQSLCEKFGAQTIRFFILQFHYRSILGIDEQNIITCGKQLEKINAFVNSVRDIVGEQVETPENEIKEIFDNCVEAMNEDFNTPVVISELLKLLKVGNTYISTKDIKVLKQINYVISKMMEDVLGLVFEKRKQVELSIPANVKELAQKRWDAKQAKNWAEADKLRQQIADLGFVVKDSKDSYEILKGE